ncbi:MAG: IS110 family transposase, partial [Firmicutes bacterium]|nr:IS110 family transposase [Bacillota bacterium]
MNFNTYVALDAHKDFISVAAAFPGGEPEDWGTIPNNFKALAKLVKKAGPDAIFCYEAGPCGYTLYRQLKSLGRPCIVAAPSLIPEKPGERRKKTDRRDAKKLARLLRSGDLTPVWVPSEEQEALRDLTRAREEAVRDCSRKKQQLSKFLLRLGVYPPVGVKPWSDRYFAWLKELTLAQEAHRILLAEYLHAVEEAAARVERLEEALKDYAAKGLNPYARALFMA